MGAGKTTIGAEVARRVDRPFVDVDDEIERAEGPIREIFAGQGEPAFRELEARCRPIARRPSRARPQLISWPDAGPARRRWDSSWPCW